MARDHSPKERQQKQLERKQGRRASYDRILIVSEGSKTDTARTDPEPFTAIVELVKLLTTLRG